TRIRSTSGTTSSCGASARRRRRSTREFRTRWSSGDVRSARDRGGHPRGDRPSGPAGHRPVLLQDVITSLQPAPGQAFVDATLGGGGYARALIERLRPGGVLLGIDRDATAIERFAQEPVPPDITLMLEHTNFAQLDRAAERIGRPANGGRVGVVSFHSLEDKIAKNLFNVEAKDCICPPQAPVCLCGHQRSVRVVTRKPITPSETEVRENPRARSAKLRVAEKL